MKGTVDRNLWKRKKGAGTWYLETTTMFSPGDMSAAEETFAEAEALVEGRKRRGSHRLMYDHRWGDCPDLADEPTLRSAIRDAYGDAMEWMDEDSLVDGIYDSRTSESHARRYFLNGQTPAVGSWIYPHEWDACGKPTESLKPGDMIVIGADGSISDDATAVVACRVSDGHLELIGCWEKPEGGAGEGWQVDRDAVDACVANAIRDYDVVGLYMDPPHWADTLDRWHNEWAEQMKVKATVRRPLEWWTNRPTQMVQALERFHEAVVERRLSFTPADDRAGKQQALASMLRRHVLNSRENVTRAGVQIKKEYPKSPKKIDGCVAAVIAWECRNDAVAAGVEESEEPFFVAKRLR